MQITQDQIKEFHKELEAFSQRFLLEGPGAVGGDLEKGVELMKKYQEEVAELEAQRQELTNAEKLFELPITMYPELLKVQKEMKGLEQIYEIYQEQKVGNHLRSINIVFYLQPKIMCAMGKK